MGDVIKLFEEGQSTEVLAFAKYQDLEKAADRTAAKIKEGFMEMGYILKVARDTDILAGSGYANHEEFAENPPLASLIHLVLWLALVCHQAGAGGMVSVLGTGR